MLVNGSKWALGLNKGDAAVTVRRNVIDGYQGYPLPLSSDTVINGNIVLSNYHTPSGRQ